MAGKHEKRRKTPWRDNIEAMTVAIVMAVMLKYFIVEAYKIPTGSMQPTLMGNDETGIFDRILVDKLSYHFRDPERFEVAVFKYPLDRSKNFIKRIVGMPGEQMRIWLGDVWTRKTDAEPWQVLRRPVGVQRETWKALDLIDSGRVGWSPENASGWSYSGRNLQARGDGRARFFQQGATSVHDNYVDGYPPKMQPLLRPRPGSGQNNVGDLRVSGRVRALPGCKAVEIQFVEGPRLYTLTFPGPAADAEAQPSIHVDYGKLDVESARKMVVDAKGAPYRLPADEWVAIAGQNLDDLLSLEIEGEFVSDLEIAPVADNAASAWSTGCSLVVQGEGADFEDLQTWRDIYYTAESRLTQVAIPEGHYFMLGDNTQDSSDSREWSLDSLSWPGAGSNGELVRGNHRTGENPVEQMGEEGMQTFFRDEWGELWVFPSQTRVRGAPVEAPFVPRELITGRAVLVFWPMVPGLGVWRLRWVH